MLAFEWIITKAARKLFMPHYLVYAFILRFKKVHLIVKSISKTKQYSPQDFKPFDYWKTILARPLLVLSTQMISRIYRRAIPCANIKMPYLTLFVATPVPKLNRPKLATDGQWFRLS